MMNNRELQYNESKHNILALGRQGEYKCAKLSCKSKHADETLLQEGKTMRKRVKRRNKEYMFYF
jgi:hypothetical protein